MAKSTVPTSLTPYEQTLLGGWEDVAKRSDVTLWILLALKAGPKIMADIKQFMLTATHGILDADDKSMYRALRRFAGADIVTHTTLANPSGPDHKLYALTQTGSHVLAAYVERNIVVTYFDPEVKKLLGLA